MQSIEAFYSSSWWDGRFPPPSLLLFFLELTYIFWSMSRLCLNWSCKLKDEEKKQCPNHVIECIFLNTLLKINVYTLIIAVFKGSGFNVSFTFFAKNLKLAVN